MNINGSTILYGIIGNPVTHSLSPAMQNAAFAACGENRVYVPLQVEDVAAALSALRHLNIGGASVTIPFKEQIMAGLDEIDPVAARIGAINTIIVRHGSQGRRLCGSNTDWLGSNRALEAVLPLAGSKAVVIGAGGAARAICFGLIEAGATIELYNRTPQRAQRLAEALGCRWWPLERLVEARGDILINTTSVGMSPAVEASPAEHVDLGSFRVVMDIVYAPLQTRLLREAAAAGCRCIDGLQMLLNQGVAQFELWTDTAAPVSVMREALLAKMTKPQGS